MSCSITGHTTVLTMLGLTALRFVTVVGATESEAKPPCAAMSQELTPWLGELSNVRLCP
ncbi:hypothetical protein SAMN05421507_1563 [Lentzea jiangxiensis]|uniref:Uncharacterized protein n=1 Tax=Lentzea jiangxiensis TaxID=641025 RepID=A0A1H0X8E6_9PSEU|nr:hypothetical protein SAMN05421507_1563 [Lentzea jiangxiensis]